MSTYKVPQDVEAEDKLLGPFTFRQFIYLLIVAAAGGIAYGLSQVFIVLAIIPLPVILFFGALALPLRKDQPMEIYLAAIVSFYLKPRKRLWDPDGIESLVEITVPRVVEIQRTKNISEEDADQRFSYLANLVDSEGWAIRGQNTQTGGVVAIADPFYAARQTEDIFDDGGNVARSLDQMMTQADAKRHEEMRVRMQQAIELAPAPMPVAVVAPPTTNLANPVHGHEKVIQPLHDPYTPPVVPTDATTNVGAGKLVPGTPTTAPGQATPTNSTYAIPESQTMPATTSENVIPAGIMSLATNSDLSVEAIAREANRIQQKENDLQDGDVISFR